MFCSFPYLFLSSPAAGSSGSKQVTFIRTGRLLKRAPVNIAAKSVFPWVSGALVLRQSDPWLTPTGLLLTCTSWELEVLSPYLSEVAFCRACLRFSGAAESSSKHSLCHLHGNVLRHRGERLLLGKAEELDA